MKKYSTFLRPVIFAGIYAFITIVTVSCHHPKSISKTSDENQPSSQAPANPDVRQVMEKLKSNELPFSELAAKMKTKVSSPSLNQSFTTNIRWKKGEKIWLSMSIIGIEGARVLITKDSIKIMDKVNGRYILKPLSYIKEKTYVDLTFSDIENLLLGQLVFTDTAKTKYADNQTNVTLTSDGMRFLMSAVFGKPSKNLSSIFVTDKMYSQTVESVYENYQLQLGKQFPMDRNLKIKNGAQIFEMNAKFQSIEPRQNLEYPFVINPDYTIEK